MMTFYTAVGKYKMVKNGLPTIITGDGRECALDAHELILWSSLAFRILNYDELREEFYKKERELHILGELDFDHYINRLTMRQLIASGRDCTGVDALYDLLGHLYAVSIPNHLLVKTCTFLKLFFSRKYTLKQAALVFHKEPVEPAEKQILALLKHQMLSTAELIQCVEKGSVSLKNSEELMNLIYRPDNRDCDSILTDGHFTDSQIPTLTAVANLYLKQQILFQIL